MQILFISVLGLLLAWPLASRAQVSVHDKHNFNQRQRMVFARWGNFTPSVYFFVVHWNYRRKDKRPLGPNGPYTHHQILLGEQDRQDEAYQESTETIRNKALVEDLNSQGKGADVAYSLYYKDVFQKLDEKAQNAYSHLNGEGREYLRKNQQQRWYEQQRAVLEDRIAGIHQSYMERGSRILAYQRIEKEYQVLVQAYTKAILVADGVAKTPPQLQQPVYNPFAEYEKTYPSDQEISRQLLRSYDF